MALERTRSSRQARTMSSADRREALRDQLVAGGGFYNPWLHLGATTAIGLAAIVAGALQLHDVRWWEIAFALALYPLANAAEWRIHKSVLHARRRFAEVLYDRHTPEHHAIFTYDDMALRSAREFRLVLIPAYGIALIFIGVLPAAALLWYGSQHNLAAIFVMFTMHYVVLYEWLHLSFHLPPESAIGRLALVRFLRATHRIHHDPRLMQRWNFNVVIPLWDLVRRTYVRDRDVALRLR